MFSRPLCARLGSVMLFASPRVDVPHPGSREWLATRAGLMNHAMRRIVLAVAVLGLVATGQARATLIIYGPGPGGSIPDANAAGITSTITVADTDTIASFGSITIT